MSDDIPIQKVVDLRSQGVSNDKIIESLLNDKYNYQQIRDAINQADIKKNVSNPGTPITPVTETPNLAPTQPNNINQTTSQPQSNHPIQNNVSTNINIDEIQRILEEIIEEKWKESEDILRQIIQWKAVVNNKVISLESRINEFNTRIDTMNSTLGKKAEEFNGTMKDVDTEIKALDKALNKLIPALSDNISELKDIVSSKK